MGLGEIYKPSVMPTGEAGIVVRQRSSSGEALRGLGQDISDVSNDYMRKMARQDAEASIAEEQSAKISSWNSFVAETATLDSGEIAEKYDEWESSERERVGAVSMNRLARRYIENGDKVYYSKTRVKTNGPGGMADKARILKMDGVWENQKQDALMGAYNPEGYQSALAAFSDAIDHQVALGRVTPAQAAKEKHEYVGTSNYLQSRGHLATIKAGYERGEITSAREAITKTQNFIADLPGIPMKVNSRQSLKVEAIYAIDGFAGHYRKKKQKIVDNIYTDAGDGTIKASQVMKAFDEYPQAVETITLNLAAGAKVYTTLPHGDPTVRREAEAVLNAVDAVLKGKSTPGQCLEVMKGSDSPMVIPAMAMLASVMADKENGAQDMAIYNIWGPRGNRTVTFAKDSFLAKVSGKMAETFRRYNSDVASVNRIWRESYRWNKENPNATLKEKNDKVSDLFKDQAMGRVREQNKQLPFFVPVSDEDFVAEYLKGTE